MIISPGILTDNPNDFLHHLFDPGLRTKKLRWHIDILDGTMFQKSCWADPDVIATWGELPEIELHLMTQNPLLHAIAWHKQVPSFTRAIVHREIERPVGSVLEQLRAMRIATSVALNPETPPEDFSPHVERADELLFMGVHPGASGQAFLGEPILAKIRRAHALFPQHDIAVDGGMNLSTIPDVAKAKATRCVCTSALWSAVRPVDAHEELEQAGHIVL